MYNHTGLQGRLTADPELRYTQQGRGDHQLHPRQRHRPQDQGRQEDHQLHRVRRMARTGRVRLQVPEQRAASSSSRASSRAAATRTRTETAAKPSRSRSTPSTSATARRTAARALAATSPIRATLRAPATSRRSRTMATFLFNLTAGRPADDQKAGRKQTTTERR